MFRQTFLKSIVVERVVKCEQGFQKDRFWHGTGKNPKILFLKRGIGNLREEGLKRHRICFVQAQKTNVGLFFYSYLERLLHLHKFQIGQDKEIHFDEVN